MDITKESESVCGSKIAEGKWICSACEEDNKTIAAVGMCEDCNDNLCDVCFQAHCVPKPSKWHLISRGVYVNPKKTSERKVHEMSRCGAHDNKAIEYYCKDHTQLGCSQCFVTLHRACKEVVVIADEASSKETMNEIEKLLTACMDIESELAKTIGEFERLRNIVSYIRDKTTEEVDQCGTMLKASVDEFLAKQKAAIDTFCRTDNEKIDQSERSLEKIRSEYTPLKETAEAHILASESACHRYIVLKHSLVDILKIKNALEEVKRSRELQKYEFDRQTAESFVEYLSGSCIKKLRGKEYAKSTTELTKMPE